MSERNLNTPLMKQYVQFKAQYPQALLLMRVGDFYEAYGEDAVVVSRVLGIVLTKRSSGVPTSVELCGFPHHAMDNYLPKLVRAGYKVAVCDQLEDPKFTKTLVKRGVTELVTPGVAYNEELLDRRENNYLAVLYFSKDEGGAAFVDVSTGEFKVAQGGLDYLDILLADFKPKEVVVQKGYEDGFGKRFGKYYISTMDEWAFVEEACWEKLTRQFGDKALKGFGIEGLTLALTAAGAALFYLEQNKASGLSSFDAALKGQGGTAQLTSISRIESGNFVWLDKFTVKNLEVFFSEGTALIKVVDKTCSPMGARMLRSWIGMPLKDVEQIEARYDGVQYFLDNEEVLQSLVQKLESIGDMERIIARAAAGKIMPRELVQLRRGLSQMGEIADLISPLKEGSPAAPGRKPIPQIEKFYSQLDVYRELSALITKNIVEEPAAALGKGDIIANGVDTELDNLRTISRDSKNYLLSLQQSEGERTGIPSLKISYNNVFGYFLEVRNTYKNKVPSDWIRKQTLVNAERYITPELKEYEEKILGAQEKILEIEQRIYTEVVRGVQERIGSIQLCCNVVANVDCLVGFARLARENSYCRPQVNNSFKIEIKQGRHPVLETNMPPGEEYVANDVVLDNLSEQIIILTGPNMAGKSALLRQTALIVLLAQCGSFVPAKSASIGIVDKIFTRVGASDNISQGESTFMVEMIETSAILHNLSARSLVLLDEIGRGTSTFDGMSIAWSIVEYLHNHTFSSDGQNIGGAKTIFATHYHELNELEKLYNRVKNYHIEVKEVDNKVIFLRRLSRGGVEHSFGIHVARMAGMPQEVLQAASEKLKQMEELRRSRGEGAVINAAAEAGNTAGKAEAQLSFFALDDPTLSALRDKLNSADLNNMTPMQAFDLLREMKKELGL